MTNEVYKDNQGHADDSPGPTVINTVIKTSRTFTSISPASELRQKNSDCHDRRDFFFGEIFRRKDGGSQN